MMVKTLRENETCKIVGDWEEPCDKSGTLRSAIFNDKIKEKYL